MPAARPAVVVWRRLRLARRCGGRVERGGRHVGSRPDRPAAEACDDGSSFAGPRRGRGRGDPERAEIESRRGQGGRDDRDAERQPLVAPQPDEGDECRGHQERRSPRRQAGERRERHRCGRGRGHRGQPVEVVLEPGAEPATRPRSRQGDHERRPDRPPAARRHEPDEQDAGVSLTAIAIGDQRADERRPVAADPGEDEGSEQEPVDVAGSDWSASGARSSARSSAATTRPPPARSAAAVSERHDQPGARPDGPSPARRGGPAGATATAIGGGARSGTDQYGGASGTGGRPPTRAYSGWPAFRRSPAAR